MSVEDDSLSERERRLGEIVFAYLQSVEKGECPCRREALAGHPEFAAELQEFFADRDRLVRITAPLRLAARETPVAQTDTANECTLGYQGTLTQNDASTFSLRLFGGYELLEELGRGGMGVVYKARQTSLQRLVALKMIRPDRLPSPADAARFRQETAAVALLDHPNIASLYEVGEHEGRHYYTMRLIEGGGLERHLDRFRDDPRAAVQLLAVVAGAVCHAHRRGILHRDLKPSNILLDAEGRPYITDFGLAKQLEGDLQLTQTGQLMGTPPYMAPEQIRGSATNLTAATDIYGLGALLYTLLTGQPPFHGTTLLETLKQIAEQQPSPPSLTNRRVDRDVQTICLKCLEKEPHKRYSCAGELLEDLQRWLAGQPIQARRASRAEKAVRWCRRYPVVTALTGTSVLLLIAVVISLAVSHVRITRQQESTEEAWQQAVEDRDTANKLRIEAEQREQLVQRHLYSTSIAPAQTAWENGNLKELRDMLSACRPSPGQADLRGFEWYYLWRLAHGEHRTLRGHAGDVYCVAFSPDGRTLASASKDRTVQLWDAATGQKRFTLKGHAGEVNCVAFSPDGALVASAGDDRTVRLWDAATGSLRATLTGHAEQVGTVAFAPDSRSLASGSHDDTIRLWDPHGARLKATLKGHTDDVESLAFSPDGKTLASAGSDDRVKLWDVGTTVERATMHGHTRNVLGLSFSHNGRKLASAGEDGAVILWNAADGKEEERLAGHANWVQSVAFSPDDRTVISAGKDGTVRLWDVGTEKEMGRILPHVGRVWWAALSPDGNTLATTGADCTIKLWDTRAAAGRERMPLPVENDRIISLALSPDGKTLAIAGYGLFDVATGQNFAVGREEYKKVAHVAFSPDGQFLATGDWVPGAVALRDPATGRVVATLGQHGDHVNALAFSPDGRTLASTAGDSAVWLWDVPARRRRAVLRAAGQTFVCLAFSPDGAILAGGSGDSKVTLFDAASEKEKATLSGHRGPVRAVAFAPSGRIVATACAEGVIKLWDPTSARELASLFGHGRSVEALDFSPDGARLASGSVDHTVRLWDPVTGREVLGLSGPASGVWCLKFSRDGNVLAASGASNRRWPAAVYLWRAAAKEEPSAASQPGH